ncbi:MAG TPA: DUF1127 domain-containing protein [Devosia sp.]|jgi:uncharacterized protein YjiS (DUF1127 family)|nr:DUF1127 domain-containing protein [Devosia sp.]
MFDRLRERLADWQIYRETIRQLHRLDPHLLADAGIDPRTAKARAWAAARARRRGL